MLNHQDQVIYIGKAKNLKNRINSYFKNNISKNIDLKTNALIKEIKKIEITITKNETEALLLENKLINQTKPKYNIIFKDDKSYPYILISNEEYPSVKYARFKNKPKNVQLYGPYPNAKFVKLSLDLLYKIFKLRSCNPIFFKNRVRPCLEYQLKRCSAPCVRLISSEDYSKEIEKVKLFLQSKSKLLIKKLTQDMQQESLSTNYELAAKLRDQIKALSLLQNEQMVLNKKAVNVDVLGVASSPNLICIHLLRIRQGDILYSRQFFSKNNLLTINKNPEELLEEFILQHYLHNIQNMQGNDQKISQILTSISLKKSKIIANILNIKLFSAKSGTKFNWQKIAQSSAEEALSSRVIEYRRQKNNFNILTELINKETRIERIACFDVSHTTGKETVAACVVFNIYGKEQSSYRLFNIKNDNPGDDYQALANAISRYIEQLITQVSPVPDLLIIDGGKGQLAIAERVIKSFEELIGISKASKKILSMRLLSLAKGEKRKPGLEKIYLTSGGLELNLQSTHQVFKLLIKIRDAAHRFAIISHRKKRDKLIRQMS